MQENDSFHNAGMIGDGNVGHKLYEPGDHLSACSK